MFILEFFRDTLDGFVYFLYLALGIFALFYLMGLVADRKRKAINQKLKEKKTYDIESGKEAAIAAMESKQILDVQEEDTGANAGESTLNSQLGDANKKEEIPSVMVFDSSDTSSNQSTDSTQNSQTQIEQPKVEEPLKIDSSSIKIDSSSIKIDSSSIKQ